MACRPFHFVVILWTLMVNILRIIFCKVLFRLLTNDLLQFFGIFWTLVNILQIILFHIFLHGIILCYIFLHEIILYYIFLHEIMFKYIYLHEIMLQYIFLHEIMFQYIFLLEIMFCNVFDSRRWGSQSTSTLQLTSGQIIFKPGIFDDWHDCFLWSLFCDWLA